VGRILFRGSPSRQAYAPFYNQPAVDLGKTQKQRERFYVRVVASGPLDSPAAPPTKVMPPPSSSPISSVFPSLEFRGHDVGLLRFLIDLWTIELCVVISPQIEQILGLFRGTCALVLLRWDNVCSDGGVGEGADGLTVLAVRF
jgi:hypothetical protein